MDVFLSWSGDRSKSLATLLKGYLPLVIQSAVPWFSPDDIDKGSRWLAELSTQLQKQSVAIICVTPENVSSPWLLFEAGALSKALDQAWVCPILLGMEPSEVKGPLAQFQSTRTTKEDVRALLGTINKRLPAPLTDSQIDTLHDALWPSVQQEIDRLAKLAIGATQPHRTQTDMLGEVLERVRALERQLSAGQVFTWQTETSFVTPKSSPKNVRRDETPHPSSEVLRARFRTRAASSERTVHALKQYLSELPEDKAVEREDVARQIAEETRKLQVFTAEVRRYDAKLERAQRMQP